MAKKKTVRRKQTVSATAFGSYYRARREALGLSLSEFCRLNGFDKGNHSRLERGLLLPPPPQERERRLTLAQAIHVREGTPEWDEFNALADAAVGQFSVRGSIHAAKRQVRLARQAGASARPRVWMTELDLQQWAKSIDSIQLLPQLIRMLVRATIESPKLVRFSAGEGVQRHGWDGIVEVAHGNDFVPDGISRWELSVEKSPVGKATEVFDQRAKEDRGFDLSQRTFVFVTPCKWDNKSKAKWCDERRSLKIWRDVLVWDSTDLEQWLEIAPAVDQWIARRTGLKPDGITDLSEHWENLRESFTKYRRWNERAVDVMSVGSSATIPVLIPNVFLAGRQEQVKVLRALFGLPDEPGGITKPDAFDRHSVLPLGSASPNDVIDFAAAMVASLSDDEREQIKSRMLVVESMEAWRDLCVSQHRLVLLAHPRLSVDPESIANATRHGHQVLLCSERFVGDRSSVVELPSPRRDELEKGLILCGLDESKAARLVGECGRSLTALKRHREFARHAHTAVPAWAAPKSARELVPMLLAGAWDDSNEADQQILARLADRRYHDVASLAACWLQKEDSPVIHIQSTWSFLSREDSWNLLAPLLTSQHLDLFQEIALEVLAVDDPKLELPNEQRWQAVLRGKRPKFSSDLRRGIAETITLLAAKSAPLHVSLRAPDRPRIIVRKLLDKASWTRWSSLSGVLSLLAEAAPDAFLSAVEPDIDQPDSATLKLFAESGGGDPMFGGCYHADLLWALETVSWDPEQLDRSVRVLARLAERKPNSGNWGNNPMSSLTHIFLPWLPQTTADVPRRIKVLNSLLEKTSDVGWRLLLNLLPDKQTSSDYIQRPKWQPWADGFSPSVKLADVYEQQSQCAALLLAAISSDFRRIEQVIADVGSFPPEQRKQLLVLLESLDATQFGNEPREVIVSAFRMIITRHRQHPTAFWVLPNEQLDRLETLQQEFEPKDIARRHAWMFRDHIELPVPYEKMDFQEQERRVREMQLEVIREVFTNNGLDGIHELAKLAKSPRLVGYLFGKANVAQVDELILPKYLSSESPFDDLGRGYFYARQQDAGWLWVEQLPLNLWTTDEAGCVLAELEFERRTWDLVRRQTREVQDYFWRHTYGRLRQPSPDDVTFAVSQLLVYQRPIQALAVLQSAVYEKLTIGADLMLKTLEAVRTELASPETANVDRSHICWEIGNLISYLQQAEDADVNRLAALEFAFLDIFDSHEAEPKTLLAMMRDDPTNFVHLIQTMFRSDREESNESELPQSEEQKALFARQGFKLLHQWREAKPPRLPGMQDDGTIDAERLFDWVKQARTKCQESGHLEICDEQIGEVLARDPEPADRTMGWPCEAIRDLLEEFSVSGDSAIIRGIEIGIFNKRGVTCRSLTAGGVQERDLAEKYRAYMQASQDEWPLVTASLKRMAERYDADALREDEEARKRL